MPSPPGASSAPSVQDARGVLRPRALAGGQRANGVQRCRSVPGKLVSPHLPRSSPVGSGEAAVGGQIQPRVCCRGKHTLSSPWALCMRGPARFSRSLCQPQESPCNVASSVKERALKKSSPVPGPPAGFLPSKPLPPFPGSRWPVRLGSKSLSELGPATSLSSSVLSSVKWAVWTR